MHFGATLARHQHEVLNYFHHAICIWTCLELSRANEAMNNFVNGVDQIVQCSPQQKSVNNSSMSSRPPSVVRMIVYPWRMK